MVLVTFLSINLASNPPLIIERSCDSKAMVLADQKHSTEEIKAFLEDAILARFNTKESNLHLLSMTELKRRIKEQAAFKKQTMRQDILIEGITFSDNETIIQTNRLISVENIRSAFIFKLRVKFAKVKRTSLNPYGLILTSVQPIEPPKKKKGKKS